MPGCTIAGFGGRSVGDFYMYPRRGTFSHENQGSFHDDDYIRESSSGYAQDAAQSHFLVDLLGLEKNQKEDLDMVNVVLDNGVVDRHRIQMEKLIVERLGVTKKDLLSLGKRAKALC